jgi:thiamine-phosphate pyrophosphorylase
VAIGGITAERAPALLRAGADGVCVGAAILGQPDPRAAARAIQTSLGAQRGADSAADEGPPASDR